MKKTHEPRCHKCVWQHTGGEYLCDFATLAAPLTRGVGTLRKHAGGMFLASDLGGYAAVASIWTYSVPS